MIRHLYLSLAKYFLFNIGPCKWNSISTPAKSPESCAKQITKMAKERYAILIGIDDHDPDGLPPYCTKDVADMEKVLEEF